MKYGLFFRFTEPVFIPLPDPPQKGGRKNIASSRDTNTQEYSADSAIILLSLIPMSGGGLVVGRYPP